MTGASGGSVLERFAEDDRRTIAPFLDSRLEMKTREQKMNEKLKKKIM